MSAENNTQKKIGPNSEQLAAIEHAGGVLLSAGAGSGKTFVLIEHMIHLASELLVKYKNLSFDALSMALKKEFSSFVLMTFTTKATGELKIRLARRIAKEIEDNVSERKWLIVKDAIEELHVSTIHGYCSTLIKQGFFHNVPSDLNIVDDASFSDKLNQLFDNWFERRGKDFLESSPELEEIFYANQDQLRSSLQQVFKTPELRESWRGVDAETLCQQNLETFVNDYFELSGLPSVENLASFDLVAFDEYTKSAWYPIAMGFLNLIRSESLSTKSGLQAATSFFQSIKRLTGPQARSGLFVVIEFFDSIKAVRSFVQEHEEGLVAFLDNREGIFRKWIELVASAVEDLEESYLNIPGMTFADLEYYVLRGLEDKESAQRVQERYKYFIVDEFQDTSFIQFSIIEKSCGNDMNKMFCVGDVKQAIYGFRGGELSVFKSCQESIPLNLELNNNYRSAEKVINFNNHFFEHLFRLGPKFSGSDKFSVPVIFQQIPNPNESFKGELNHVSINVSLLSDNASKLKATDMNHFEAQAILSEIQRIKNEFTGETICILYKNLKPSKLLIKLLMDAQIGFTAQVKVPFGEEPVVAIFQLLLESVLQDKTGGNPEVRQKKEMLLNAYFHYLQVKNNEIRLSLDLFYQRLTYSGFFEAFQVFLKEIGLLNSNHQNNLRELQTLFNNSHGNLEKTFQLLRARSQGDFSIPFISGDLSEQVIIMTAHGSKGLEFEHVILGGIHTNGTVFPKRDYFGKIPGSMRWKVQSAQKKPYKSPAYIIEDLREKRKDFSESKRLFYVAATRAVKTLTWCDISLDSQPVSSSENSWVVGLRQVITEMILTKVDLWKDLAISQQTYEREFTPSTGEEESEDFMMPPLFHLDTLGVNGEDSSCIKMGLVSELSVTGLSQLALCPRKFFLSQICKFKSEEFISSNKKEQVESEEIQLQSSSMARGSLVHQVISDSIKANFTIPLSFLKESDGRDRESVEWAVDFCRKSASAEATFISELPIKFSFFGHMISGTPDVVVVGEDGLKIIDFKTGKRKESDQVHYWHQLMIYAYAYLNHIHEKPTDSVEIALMYVDEQVYDKQILSKTDLNEALNIFWRKTSDLSQVNREHCKACSFGNLCLS